MGTARAQLVKAIELERGDAAIRPASWVPAEYAPTPEMLTLFREGTPVKEKEQIGRIIFQATVADRPVSWSVVDRKLKLRYGSESVIAFTPEKNVSDADLKAWAASFNVINTEVSELAKATDKRK